MSSRFARLSSAGEPGGVSCLKKADLIDRIVEQIIGYRLNSTAIRRL